MHFYYAMIDRNNRLSKSKKGNESKHEYDRAREFLQGRDELVKPIQIQPVVSKFLPMGKLLKSYNELVLKYYENMYLKLQKVATIKHMQKED